MIVIRVEALAEAEEITRSKPGGRAMQQGEQGARDGIMATLTGGLDVEVSSSGSSTSRD
jgi:hypothetical protein